MKVFLAAVGLIPILVGNVAQAEEMPRVASYAIDVSYLEEEPGIEARADIEFVKDSATPQIMTFYLHGELWVDLVKFDGEPAPIEQDLVFYSSDYSCVARRTRIDMTGRELPKTVSVTYSGKLNPSVVRSPSNYMRVDADGVFLRSYLYSVWFPVFLEAEQDTYPVDIEVTVRTPSEFMAVLTGERLADEVEGEVRVSRWRSLKDSLFNAQLTARRFELMNEGGFHLYLLGDSESRATAGEILAYSSRVEEFFRTHYSDRSAGGQLHVVQMPRFGDISSGNMVGISDRVWREFERASYSGRTLAHELVHPYVKIAVPRSSELYALVIEGFPSYFHLPALAEILGEDFYRQLMVRTEEAYLQRRQTGLDRRGNPLPKEKPLLTLTADDIRLYKDRFVLNDRTRLFFDWMRNRMGRVRFTELTRELFSLESLDFDRLVAIIESHLPESGDDVTLWLRTTEYPERFRTDGARLSP